MKTKQNLNYARIYFTRLYGKEPLEKELEQLVAFFDERNMRIPKFYERKTDRNYRRIDDANIDRILYKNRRVYRGT